MIPTIVPAKEPCALACLLSVVLNDAAKNRDRHLAGFQLCPDPGDLFTMV